ncbi:hypothetical protein DPEC_G00328570 [Dallia pectoralis]|uniref:Uncharacterized protein n=1 Tax=Dallia pectoralis TaxID=75939 RepID=A0ACC2F8F5_DALPE|nr:hypothetical protein DPEC_G00328570 [Dallia pectoralis]
MHNSSLHSVAASDASLLSSMLDESCIQERTLVDSFWGLDEDAELKADQSLCGVNGDVYSAQTQASVLNGRSSQDSTIQSDKKMSLTTQSSKYSSSAAPHGPPLASSPLSTVYARERIRKHNTGPRRSVSDTCVLLSRRVAACVVYICLVLQNVLLRKPEKVKVIETCLRYSRRAATKTLSVLMRIIKAFLKKAKEDRKLVNRAHSSYCGSVNVKDLGTDGRLMNRSGSLCDDCKGKQHLETIIIPSSSWVSWSHHMLGALWSVTTYTGSRVLWLGQKTCSAVSAVAGRILSVLWLAALSPGKAATGAFRWLGTGWYQLVTLLSLLNMFVLTRVLSKLLKLLLVLLPFLFLLGLWHWGPSSLLSLISVVNVTEWRTVFSFSSSPDQPPLEQTEGKHPFTAPPTSPTVSQPGSVLASVDSERLTRLERRLAQLWDKVDGGDRSRERQHREVLGLYQTLQGQLDTRMDKDRMELWASGQLDERLALLKRELENDASLQRVPSQNSQKQLEVQQRDQASRLAQLEALLQTLAAKTQEVQRRQEAAASAGPVPVPVHVSVGVNSESHDALLAEVKRLEAALGSIRQDLLGVMGCQGACQRLDSLDETVSAQVKQELRSWFYGTELTSDHQPGEEQLPESLLQWLSERYVNEADLQTSLATLELSILRNVSLQLEKDRDQDSQEAPSSESITQTVRHTIEATGMSEEHVQLIVKNALNLYSQDRNGLADYALESGGGSVLGTRCSEAYKTKTALLSLFGLPLWYFSQSPRVVIQPDVHPGNCWAFQGSQGYLVIRLSMRIVPSAFSLEHTPKALAPSGSISSAPRHFNVYGLDDEDHDEGKLLGSYTYQEDGDTLQTYPVTEENDQAYQIIEVRVLSNWGNPEYTCLYRIRVHGQPGID